MAVSLRGAGSPAEIANIITDGVVSSAASCSLVDRIDRKVEGRTVIFLVFEKYYMRSSNRASLSVMVSPGADGYVNVDAVGAGGGTGVFLRFSWGTEQSFEATVCKVLEGIGFAYL